MHPRLDELKVRKERLDKQIQLLQSKEAMKEKKLDTRRKILLGAMVQAWVKHEPDAEKSIRERLNHFLVKDSDRKLFDL